MGKRIEQTKASIANVLVFFSGMVSPQPESISQLLDILIFAIEVG
jgi:hypothetical protein